MNEIERAALADFPQIQRLIDLKAGGAWIFRPVRLQGGLELLAGARAWPDGWSDAIAIRNVDDAKAYRCNPDGGQVWNREGGLVDVIDALVELPPPGAPGAPRLVIGRGPTLWTPS